MKKMIMRKGVAMIELIFAIVIMAFVMLSLPMLMQQVKTSHDIGIKQESISLIAAQVNLIMTQQWDDVQTRADNEGKVLDTKDGVAELSRNAAGLRGSRTITNSRLLNASGPLFASDNLVVEVDKDVANLLDDVDDFNNRSMSLVVDENVNNDAEYIDNQLTVDTTVSYTNYGGNFDGLDINVINNGPSAVSTNIKTISAKLTTTNARTINNKIFLRAFTTNIGGYNPEIKGGI